MKYFLIAILSCFSLTNSLLAQQSVCLGDDLLVCGGAVDIENCAPGGVGGLFGGLHLDNPTVIPTLTDDSWSAAVNIGFDFTFYNNTYNQFAIGSNGIISFNIGNANGYCPWALGAIGALPSAATTAIHNSIMPAYQDMNPSLATNPDGDIQYQTIGTAPNRMCVILYKEIGAFQCNTECNYLGVVLFETSNNIEIHIGKKTVCGTWNGSLAIQGIQNNGGSVAHITPGRNNSIWTADNDGYRWEYQGGNNYAITQIPYIQVTGANNNLVWNNTLGNTFPFTSTLSIADVPSGTTGYFLTASACGAALGAVSDTTYLTTASPEVIASSSDDICSQGIGSVTANPGPGSPSPYTFSWPALGAATQTVNNVLPGTYSIFMVDGNGCPSNATITVGDSPASFSGSTTSVSCTGGLDGTATALMTPTDDSETFLWSDNQTTATATGLSAGIYTCVVTSQSGCIGNVSVTINEIPEMLLSIENQTDVLCHSLNNGGIEINTSMGTGPYGYSWDQSASMSNNANDLYAGTHTVTVTDFNGCTGQITATIGEPDSLSIIDITEDSVICADAFIDIQATGSGGSSPYIYTWTANGTSIDMGQTITVNPNANSTQYCVTLTEECGSPSTQQCMLITFPNNIDPVIDPGTDIQCVPGDFVFFNNTMNGADVFTTEFIFSNGDVYYADGTESIQTTFSQAGTYDCFVNITSNYGCTYQEEFQNIITVTPPPTANFVMSKNPATWFETEIQVTEACIGNVVDFQWFSQGSTSLNSNEGVAFITYPEGVSGTYPITLIATTNEGCSDTITLDIEIIPDIIFYSPNTFTPDNDEHNQTWNIVIEGIDIQNFTLEIFNKWGQTIWESKDINAKWDGTYGNETVPDGTYIWRVVYKELENDGRKIHTGYINVIR
ncbi:MAG: gliding motility-associated C-terminal domain-containing protein [Crocinitomicaceae bacterium]